MSRERVRQLKTPVVPATAYCAACFAAEVANSPLAGLVGRRIHVDGQTMTTRYDVQTEPKMEEGLHGDWYVEALMVEGERRAASALPLGGERVEGEDRGELIGNETDRRSQSHHPSSTVPS